VAAILQCVTDLVDGACPVEAQVWSEQAYVTPEMITPLLVECVFLMVIAAAVRFVVRSIRGGA
jgi:hypothetical protein